MFDAEDEAQDAALALLEAEACRRHRRRPSRYRTCTMHHGAHTIRIARGTRSVGGGRTAAAPPDVASSWDAVEAALLYAPLSCPACGASGEWVSRAPKGAVWLGRSEVCGSAWWDRHEGLTRGVGAWVCRGRVQHATQYPATRARDSR